MDRVSARMSYPAQAASQAVTSPVFPGDGWFLLAAIFLDNQENHYKTVCCALVARVLPVALCALRRGWALCPPLGSRFAGL